MFFEIKGRSLCLELSHQGAFLKQGPKGPNANAGVVSLLNRGPEPCRSRTGKCFSLRSR
ncbi:hypothetical protein FQN60_002433 [Etheostoma spectabile]|uniref:Uncharacterized protein n=1 Tax=Etheostoma spectabile TaxID=54343 RepID=A0A5J5DDG9_9PERO|nr:hypothetical protein FQN60_002433 [Etheostoma spectabile]